MQEIYKNIFVEAGYPGVTLGALVLRHGTVLIDAPLRPEDTRSWRAMLSNHGSVSNRILVNLDAHPDRTLGARAMECSIVAHQKTAQVFRSRPSVFKGQNIESGAEWETYNDAIGTRWAAPDLTFTQRLFLHWGPPDLILDHHPGPALGSIWAILPEIKIIFVGDTVVYNQPPFLANADIPAWQEALDYLHQEYSDYTIVSGRGGPVPVEAIKQQQTFFKNVVKGMEKFAKNNNTAEVTEKLIPGLLQAYSFSPHLAEQYAQRLRHGLNEYYTRRYRPQDFENQPRPADSEPT
jgi:glyoxylase-like metal-dependent hydrolase (beta-lactamase superfamily II)